MILEFEDVSVAYGRTLILRDVSFAVESGEIVSLIGRNGVGKTTLMRAVIGLLSPRSGNVRFKDESVTDETADERARRGMGFVPQNRDVFPRLTVEENLRVGEQVNEASPETRYEEVYRYFPRLEERRDQVAGTMSGGEQQMLAIGRALVGDPDLLLLDEPSEGVQPTIVEQIGETIQRISRQTGTTILFVEQNLDFTVRAGGRTYIMEKGQIIDEEPAADLHESEAVQKYLTI